MDKNSERKSDVPEVVRAFRRQMFTEMAEIEEKRARAASDPKERENHERLAKASRRAARDWE